MSEAYIGEIRAFGFTFAPYNWMFCNGQLLPISSYTALFSIIGTYYGGNGTTNFGLPNLQGQIPMHWGTGQTTTVIGEPQGQPNVTLSSQQMPQHIHNIYAATIPAAQRTDTPNSASYIADAKGGDIYQTVPVSINSQFSPKAISMAGGNIPHDNMQPYLALNFCICFNGYFPTRS